MMAAAAAAVKLRRRRRPQAAATLHFAVAASAVIAVFSVLPATVHSSTDLPLPRRMAQEVQEINCVTCPSTLPPPPPAPATAWAYPPPPEVWPYPPPPEVWPYPPPPYNNIPSTSYCPPPPLPPPELRSCPPPPGEPYLFQPPAGDLYPQDVSFHPSAADWGGVPPAGWWAAVGAIGSFVVLAWWL